MVYDKSKTSSKETSIKNKYVMGKCCFKIYFVLIIRLYFLYLYVIQTKCKEKTINLLQSYKSYLLLDSFNFLYT